MAVPGGGSDRRRLDRVEDGGIAVVDSAQHPLVGVGGVAVEDPGGGCLAGVPAEFFRFGDDRRRDLGQPPGRLQEEQVSGPVASKNPRQIAGP